MTPSPIADTELLHAEDLQGSKVLAELGAVLDSPAFKSSPRAREFLAYVVHQALRGEENSLKERSIGVQLYRREPTYLTGDDPVVRVKAAEVRRRLLRH